jgi:hypothetical protein
MPYLAAALAVLACLRVASAADDDEAAFGLRWSQSESELKSSGVILPGAKREQTLHGSARRYLVGRLPGSFADVEDCSLSFNTSGELAKIFCAGKNIEDEPYGTAMKSRYDELKALVSKRFGKPRSFEHQDDLWADRNEWWSLSRQSAAHGIPFGSRTLWPSCSK